MFTRGYGRQLLDGQIRQKSQVDLVKTALELGLLASPKNEKNSMIFA